MSSTNRGAKRSPQDFYGTEAFLVDAILPHLPLSGRILDAGAGEGQITARLLAAGIPADRIAAVEIDEGRAAICRSQCPGVNVIVGDYLTLDLPPTDTVVCNQPYAIRGTNVTAFAFVKRSYDLVGPKGTVSALLRLNWLEGAMSEEPERLAFLGAHPPDVFISPKRGKFGLNKSRKLAADSCAYAWITFGPDRIGRVRHLDVDKDGNVANPYRHVEKVDPRQVALFDLTGTK